MITREMSVVTDKVLVRFCRICGHVEWVHR
jgi:hypothetical protein